MRGSSLCKIDADFVHYHLDQMWRKVFHFTPRYDHLEEEESLPFASQNFKPTTLPKLCQQKIFEYDWLLTALIYGLILAVSGSKLSDYKVL